MTRKMRDHRYGVALEAAEDILIGDFGIAVSDIETDTRVRRTPSFSPDVYDDAKRVGVVIGILREESLMVLLETYEWIVHLPLPEEFGVHMAPTHFRAFKRTKAIQHGGTVHEIWGGSLTHGRSKLTLKQKAGIDAKRLMNVKNRGE